MSDSAREVILKAVLTAVNGAGGAPAYRDREAPVERGEGPVIIVTPAEESAALIGVGVVMRDLVVLVTVVTRGALPSQVADPVILALHAALLADTTLGGRCNLITEEGTRFDFESADQTALASEVRYRIRYATPAGSLAALA